MNDEILEKVSDILIKRTGAVFAFFADHRESEGVFDVSFYSDKEMSEMILVENMLSVCDSLDLKLLDIILKGGSYEIAAEQCFTSHNTVKYRIKKLMNLCKTESKKEFLNLIKKYC